MKLLIDMNLPVSWVKYLAKASVEAVYWSSLGPIAAPDTDIIARAKEGGYVIMTRDLDFGVIMFMTRAKKPSVVQIRVEDVRPEIIGELVVNALRQTERDLQAGALLTIEPQRARIRLLPFHWLPDSDKLDFTTR
jgi:predicted nuclease of predicted toxin-antitoxin system